MNKEKFIRLSGWALIVGAFAWIIGWAVGFVQPYDPYNALIQPAQKYLQFMDGSEEVLLPSAIFLLSLGSLGFYLRYAGQSSRTGKAGLVVSAAGSLLALAAYFLMLITQFEYLWLGVVVGMLLTFGGMILFGAAALRNHILPRGNVVPLVVGLCGLPAILGLGGVLFVLSGVGILVLGYLLQWDARAAAQPASG